MTSYLWYIENILNGTSFEVLVRIVCTANHTSLVLLMYKTIFDVAIFVVLMYK